MTGVSTPLPRRTIDDVLADARAGIVRLSPTQAAERHAAGAVLVDIRPAAQRAAEGEIPGSLVIERNVLEWRFDPASTGALPDASLEREIVVFCSEGYTSSLAAAALVELGIARTTDLEGGFLRWRADGFPTSATVSDAGSYVPRASR
jgi:rhodanese-related sulfurtransferase